MHKPPLLQRSSGGLSVTIITYEYAPTLGDVATIAVRQRLFINGWASVGTDVLSVFLSSWELFR